MRCNKGTGEEEDVASKETSKQAECCFRVRLKLQTSCLLGSGFSVYKRNAKVHYCRNNQYLHHREHTGRARLMKESVCEVSLRNHGSGLPNLDKQVIKLFQYKLPERSACKQIHVR